MVKYYLQPITNKNMTQLESAKNGIATPEMKAVASAEGIALDSLVSAIADGTAVIPFNP